MRRRNAITAPDVPGGAILNPCKGFFSVIVPVARTNLVTNPSVELATTGYTAVGGSVTRTTGASYHGAYSLSVALRNGITGAQDGAYYGTVSLTAGTTYAASLKFKTFASAAGLRYQLSVATTGGVDLATYSFLATGRWQWVWVYWTETSTTTRRIYIRKNDTREDTQASFLVDGVQVEALAAGETVSTFIDGDQQGLLNNQFPYPYQWNGTPHASTSTRLATTRAGGMVVNLDRFRYRVLAYTGLGLTAVANIASIPAAADGGTYQATIARPRSFAISGFFDAPTMTMLDQARSDLHSALGPDGAVPRQPSRLVYQALDGQDARSQIGAITAAYEHGLEGATTNMHRETAPITFTAYIPTVQAGDGGQALTVQTTVTNANMILQRSAGGVWSAMGTGTAGGTSVYAIAIGLDGSVYAGGDFTTMGGVVNTSCIAKWDPVAQTWSALSTGMTGVSPVVRALAIAPNGDLIAGGFFTDAGGSGADHIARWNGSAWSVIGSATAINAIVRSLAFDAAGNLYAGGDFTNAGGVAAADSLAKWDGSAWSAVGGTSINNSVWSIAVGLDGSTLYIAGTFTDAGAVADADNIAYYNGAWNAMGTGATAGLRSVTVGVDGSVYAGGSTTTLGGITVNYIGRWNGTGWSAMGTGMDVSVDVITPLADRTIAAGGDFTTAGGVTLPDHIAIWNGSAWTALDADFPGAATVTAIAQSPISGTIYVGYSTTGSATVAGVTATLNLGTARTYPTLTIKGPSTGTSRIYALRNVTTGKVISFNYLINAGETLVVRAAPAGTSITSSFRGNVTDAILPGSSPDFALERGLTSISFFAAGSTVTAVMAWPIMYQSLSDLTD